MNDQKDKKCLVIEKRFHIGGNIYTKNIENINVHSINIKKNERMKLLYEKI